MLELTLKILNGQRRGSKLTIFEQSINSFERLDGSPFLYENEAVEISIRLPKSYKCNSLIIYDALLYHAKEELHDDCVTYTWVPIYRFNNPEALFLNFFGLTEISLDIQSDISNEVITFEAIDILATKLAAQRVEKMLDFLASLSDKHLLSAFSVTKKVGGIEHGENSPEIHIERIKKITDSLEYLLPIACRRPITKLTLDYQVQESKPDSIHDDNTIAWLCSNLSVLEPTDNIDDSHIQHQGNHYHSSLIESPMLLEDTDIYENRVLHGFIENLITEVKVLCEKFEEYNSTSKSMTNIKRTGSYRSFYSIMSKFSSKLVKPKLIRCNALLDKLFRLKLHLNKYMPVGQTIRALPKVSPKVRVNKVYLDIYYQILNWTGSVKPNWLLHDNLMGIKSIPSLFEFYCYCRVSQALKNLVLEHCITPLSTTDTEYTLFDGSKISLLYEPSYWTVNHNNSLNKHEVNSEGWTKYFDKTSGKYSFRERGSRGVNSRRAPDIVIKLTRPHTEPKLIILDAKYTNSFKAFDSYLPELTMKYVHGIHSKVSSNVIVDSLTILYPDDFPEIKSFHNHEYAFYGSKAVKPALQCTSLVPSKEPSDELSYLLEKLLSLSNNQFAPSKNSNLSMVS